MEKNYILSVCDTESLDIVSNRFATLEEVQKAMKEDYESVLDNFDAEDVYTSDYDEKEGYAFISIDGGYDYMWRISSPEKGEE